MKHVYRVILTVSYYEVHFDFVTARDATDFCTEALTHMTDREDGKECHMVIKKISLEQEKAEEEDKND